MFRKDDEARQAVWFQSHFNCILTPVEKQGLGCQRDYTITKIHNPKKLPVEALNQNIEFKYDKASRGTGNLYLETRQTFDFGNSYHESGMVLAVAQSMYIVFSVPHFTETHHYVIPAPLMRELLTRKLRAVRTHNTQNGNAPGVWTYGALLPVRSPELKHYKFIQLNE